MTMTLRWIVPPVICVLIAGCGVAAQPESVETVAAFEVPLRSEADRNQFVLILRAVAAREGMHVDVESAQDLARETKAGPLFAKTMNLAVWRGANDDEAIASAMDLPDNLGQVWILFSRGKDPTLSNRFRESAMREIMLHWPDTLALPIMPTGASPLRRDLIRTPNGYIVNPSEAHRYELQGAEMQPHSDASK